MASENNQLPPLFRFFTEVGIIAQLSSNFADRVLPEGVTRAQFALLNHFVRLGGPFSPAQLANSFQVTKGAISQLMQKLTAGGWIEVAPDPNDGRGKLVSITPAGVNLHRRCLEALAKHMGPLTKDIPLDELERALPLLERVRRLLDEKAR